MTVAVENDLPEITPSRQTGTQIIRRGLALSPAIMLDIMQCLALLVDVLQDTSCTRSRSPTKS